ncbi:MAG: hypothetical protein JWM26_3292 [Betaproteobacteria bacterium]|nr:hypothetical protein [Betaproteobacteria bacterium]
MKRHAPRSKADRQSGRATTHDSPVGENGAVIAPPAYGLDFLDNRAGTGLVAGVERGSGVGTTQLAGRALRLPAVRQADAALDTGNVVQRVKWGNLALGALGTVATAGLTWLSPRFRAFMSDAWHDEVVLAEEQRNTAQSGQTIRYTPLAAGCMAVTALFQGGGGAGVHLAMQPHNAQQWADFMALLQGNTVTGVFVDSDMLGVGEGWRFKFDIIMLGPESDVAPMSTAALIDAGMTPQEMNDAGWVIDMASVREWFTAALGVLPQFTQNTSPAHAIP